MFLPRLAKILNKYKVPYALVGGYAVALHGAVRGTLDVDIVLRLSQKDFLGAEKAFHELGLESRLPLTAKEVFLFREEYIQNKNLIAWNFFNPQRPSEIVDVILTHDLNKMTVAKIKFGDEFLNVASIKDLIFMKTASGRPQDIQDINALKELSKK